MKGYRFSKDKKTLYIYDNVITEEERRDLREFFDMRGVEIKHKDRDTDTTRKTDGYTGAKKDELLKWLSENDKDNYSEWEKKFNKKVKNKDGKFVTEKGAFQKTKKEMKKKFPKYPSKE